MEKTIRLGCFMAWLTWGVAVALTLTGTIVGLEGGSGAVVCALMAHAALAAIAAGTLTVRNMFERQNQLVLDAYKLGRERGRVRAIGV